MGNSAYLDIKDVLTGGGLTKFSKALEAVRTKEELTADSEYYKKYPHYSYDLVNLDINKENNDIIKCFEEILANRDDEAKTKTQFLENIRKEYTPQETYPLKRIILLNNSNTEIPTHDNITEDEKKLPDVIAKIYENRLDELLTKGKHLDDIVAAAGQGPTGVGNIGASEKHTTTIIKS